ncbi:hypothetical protein C7T94_18150 [Pedobacter yulinensis]|uniref:Aerotolerance regulator N-terminal domain-containing protein n=1 Tax=Pedobacter yulinensis TaxID=2126353 RepID=A0A2T3HH89_9SPHI|nr:BatA domain-containing protein [Pedobacter yulinensis]PST81792.1 hypothetical protein C7T94_18150 [Pedobacter yulinensis]
MNFLYPGFLFALFAAAIPVIIHLFNFRKFRKVNFSNVAFIKEIEERNASREKLKNLLVMAARMLALVFLVLAFAQPFLAGEQTTGAAVETTVSIYIDNSYSMDAVNKDGNLLDEAKRRAREIAAGYALNDRFQLLTNDFEGRHQRLLSREAFISALDEVKISPATRTLRQVTERQQAVFTGSGNRQLYVVSDFQRGFADGGPLRVDSTVRVAFVKLRANAQPNVAVDSVWTAFPVHRPDAAEKLIVRLRNYGNAPARNVPLRLTINGAQKAVSSVSIAAGKSATDTLAFSGLRAGWQQGELQIKDFPVTFDDRFLFAFEVRSGQPILHIKGPQAGPQMAALLASEPFFKTTPAAEGAINASALDQYSLVILNALEQPSDGLGQAVRGYADRGGAVLVIPDLSAKPQVYTDFLRALGLPGILALDTTATRVSSIDLRHPLYRNVFDDVPGKLSLPEVRRHVRLEGSGASRQDILSLPGNQPAFAVFSRGRGSIYLSTAGFGAADGDFSRHPVVVPLLLNIALASGRQPALYHVVGRDASLQAPQAGLSEKMMPRLVSGSGELIPELRQEAGQTVLHIADQAREQDFYSLRTAAGRLAEYAFNTGRGESDMHYADNALLRSLGSKQQIRLIDMGIDSLAAGVAGQNNRVELWKLCLILALAFIAAEIVLIRFLNHSGNKKAS